ncbi:CotH kinase family protein [Clostridium massiliamazoniense]|uniref:CotH kinase family protein n=1 Tax=Clostridium massiliamazoniense TaxID=1347366 RepID=UPI0006D8480F|nr:CotH kinase family protein [Clostridium massiliamazoniense]
MLREKHKEYISIISIVLSILFVISSIFFTNNITVPTMATEIEEVLDKNKVTKINIEIDESNWNSLIENALDEEYVNANITIDNEKFYNVGIRAKGNSSLRNVANNPNSDRYSFKVDFSEYVDGQTYHGIEKLALNNMISDPTYFKEYISYDIYKFLGIATPEYSYADISINGESWGLYLALEVMEERFIEKNYGELEGNLYKPESMEMGGNKGGNGERPNGEKLVEPKGEGFENLEKPNNTEAPNNLENPNLIFNEENKVVPNNENDKVRINENIDGNSGASKNVGNNLEEPSADNKNVSNLEQQNTGDEKKNNLQGKGPMGGKSSNGGDLKYIDENPESYSAIKDNIIFKSTTDKDFSKVIEMIKNLNNGENLEKYLNVDEILRYFAVNTFLVNLDSYSGGMYHNYYLYEKDSVFEVLPWDLNLSFGGFGINDGSSAVNFPIDNPVKGNLESAPLINELLKVDEYKEIYHGYLSKIVNEYVNSGIFENTVLKLDKLIGNYVKTDKTAFYTYEQYKQAIPELITFTKDRASSVKAQLAGEQPTTEYGNIKSTVNMRLLGDMGNGGGNKGAMKEENAINNDTENNPNNNVNNSSVPNKDDNGVNNIPSPEGDENIMNNQKPSREPNETNRPNKDNKMLNVNNNYGKTSSKIYYLSLFFVIVPLVISIRYVTKFKRKR